MSDLSTLPPPIPLRRALQLVFRWGEQRFELIATAASIRSTFYEQTGQEVTWLQCKAIQLEAIVSGGDFQVTNYLIPAHYVTHATPGPAFHLKKSKAGGDIGVFPPTQPTPADSIPLADLDRAIAGLMDLSLN